MCGIVGYIGSKQALPILLDGLARLEYRGYDSAGIALMQKQEISVHKKAGKLNALTDHLSDKDLPGSIGIGHTRWATHGGVNDINAHPHTCCNDELVLIHNGIIENYLEIKDYLVKNDHKIRSETDTEILAHLIEDEYSKKSKEKCQSEEILYESVREALNQIEGGYAIVVMHRAHPEELIAARMHNPLILGLGKEENFVGSDIPALLKHTKEVYDLKNGEIARITKNNVQILDLHGHEHKMTPRHISWDAEQAEKEGYPHFLIKEIHETPRVVRDVLTGKLDNKLKINAAALGFEGLDLKNIEKITFLACGSAAYACQYGKYLFERWGRVTSEVMVGSEFRYHEPIIDKNTLIIALSQSGETADTLASIAKAKQNDPARIIGVINAAGSSMTREVDQVCMLQAGPEISVASTKAFSSMITTLALMAAYIGQQRSNSDSFQASLKQIRQLPELIENVLKLEDQIAKISTYYIHHQSAYFIGRDVNYPSALEGSQKLKELSYIHAEAYPAGELKHGANAVIYEGFPIICLAPEGRVYKKTFSNIQEMKARGANILSITSRGAPHIEQYSDHTIYLPRTTEEVSVMLNTIAMQLFAYYVTLYKGYSIDNPRALEKYYPKPGQIKKAPKSIDIDKPRNLAKSVTVE